MYVSEHALQHKYIHACSTCQWIKNRLHIHVCIHLRLHIHTCQCICNMVHMHTCMFYVRVNKRKISYTRMHSSQITYPSGSRTLNGTLHKTATHCNTLQHTAIHCNTLHHTATHCNNTLILPNRVSIHVSAYTI